jgi:hypothetical protein
MACQFLRWSLGAQTRLQVSGVVPRQVHDPPGLREREGPVQDGVEHAEDRRVRAHAERQREEDDRREPRSPAQRLQGVGQVVAERRDAPPPLPSSFRALPAS